MRSPNPSSAQRGFLPRASSLLTLFLVGFAFTTIAGSAKDKRTAKSTTVPAIVFAESKPVREMPAMVASRSKDAPGGEKEINPENREIIRHIDPKAIPTADKALYSNSKAGRAPQPKAPPAPSLSFEGISQADTIAADPSQGFLPPDTNGAVGPNHYVQAVNVCFRVWNKSGTPATATTSFATLFSPLGCGTSIDGDPIVLYDQLADRWIIAEFCTVADPNNHMLIAVSKTSDPTGAYYLYNFPMPNNKFPDYPHLSVWPDGYYMTDNQFNQAGTAFQQAGVFAFNRAKMLAGDPTASFVYFDTAILFPPGVAGSQNGTDGIGGMLPANADGYVPPPVGAPCPFAYVQAGEFGDPGDQIRIFDFHVDFVTTANSTFTERTGSPLPVAAFDPTVVPAGSRNVIPQPAPATSTSYVDAIADRVMFRLAYRNFGSSESLVLNHTVNAVVNPAYQAGVRFYQLTRSTPSAAFTIAEQQTFAGAPADTTNRWMGSCAMNFQGDIALGYSVSSTTVFPSIRYAAKLFTDPPGGGLAQGEQTIIAGAGSQTSTSGRWGDYSDLTVDPTDDCTFWYTQEYYAVSSASGWQTRIAKFVPGTLATSPRGTISGTITNCASGLPIQNAIVSITGGFSRATAADGTYGATVAPGTYVATVTFPGATTSTSGSLVVTNGGTATFSTCLTGSPLLAADTASITADSCNSNGIIDPNEMVTISFGIKNTGLGNTTNLVATLQATGGVTSPSAPQNYGVVVAGGATVSRSFSFTAGNLNCGDPLVATLQLQDGATNLGTITYNFTTGQQLIALNENFDAVVAPALPASWVATNVSGAAPLWVTSATTPDTAPNDAFVDDPAAVSDKVLDTPNIAVTSTAAQVSFRNNYGLESTFDGAVLEVSSPNINAGAFTDITNAAVGGSFISGGYNATISTGFSSPIAGRQAWSGSSGGYVTTVANLGPNVAGQTIKLRFRMASDTSVSSTGWRIDTVKVSNGTVCCGALITAVPPAAITAENFTPPNMAADPGEFVTVNLSLHNVGGSNTTSLVATLQATGGVTSPSGPQNYGIVTGMGPTVSRTFSFIASGTCGNNITLTLALQDGSNSLGTVTYTMRLGTLASVALFSEAFDGVTAPALPAGWTTAATGGESAWVTSTTNPNSALNDAFAPDVTTVGNTELVTPTIAVPVGGGQLTFKNLYNMEAASTGTTGFDGMVLEISINGGAFADITTGANAFLAGGYNKTISSSFGNPLVGRSAWSGLSGGTTAAPTYITSTINLPAAAAGQNIKLKWRVGTDTSAVAAGAAGVRIDNISVSGSSSVCVSNQAPLIINGPPPSPVIVGTPYSFSFAASGNPTPTYSVSGTLPPGLSLSGAGVLAGTATSGGTGSFPGITVTATNAVAPDAMQTFALNTATRTNNYIASFGLVGPGAALTADPDRDGLNNLLEYGLGLNPTVNSLSGLPVVTLKNYSGTTFLSMLFHRSSLATDLTYIVQGSSDLVSWTNLGTSTAGGVTSGTGFFTETGSAPNFTVEVKDTVPYNPMAPNKRFMRLMITSP